VTLTGRRVLRRAVRGQARLVVGASVLLMQRELHAMLPSRGATTLLLEEAVDGENGEDLPLLSGPENLAYMIYTSGSTGMPKAAMNAHGPVCNRLVWMQNEYQIGRDDAILQKTPFSFDVSVWEFFWPLLAGAKLVMARAQAHKDPAYLIDVVKREEITTIHYVPSMLQSFLEHEGVETCSTLLRVICSGEALPFWMVKRLESRAPGKRPDASLFS